MQAAARGGRRGQRLEVFVTAKLLINGHRLGGMLTSCTCTTSIHEYGNKLGHHLHSNLRKSGLFLSCR